MHTHGWGLGLLLLLGLSFGMGDTACADADRPPGPGEAPVVGAPYPPLRLPTVDGSQTVDLRSLHGRKLLLIEFASW